MMAQNCLGGMGAIEIVVKWRINRPLSVFINSAVRSKKKQKNKKQKKKRQNKDCNYFHLVRVDYPIFLINSLVQLKNFYRYIHKPSCEDH
jgi:hypothetical protein